MLDISIQFFGGRGSGGGKGASGGRASSGGGSSGEQTFNQAVQYGMKPRGTVADVKAVERMNADNSKRVTKTKTNSQGVDTKTTYDSVTVKTSTKGYAVIDSYSSPASSGGGFSANVSLGGKLLTVVSGSTRAETVRRGKSVLIDYISGYNV